MSEHVTPLDATFLELEQADESAHMHIGGVLVFDSPAPPAPELTRQVESRLDVLPRYRQRLTDTHTGGLSWPEWETDPEFAIAHHVHRAALPSPGAEAELLDWVADYWSQRLDRRHPLWDMVILEGLEGDRWALCTKTHHSMVDGVGSMDVGHLLLDSDPIPQADGPSRHPAHATGERRSWPLQRVSGAALKGARIAAETATHPAKLRDMLERSRALASLIVREEVIAAPASSLNHPIGVTRRFAVVRAPLAELKAIRRALGGTVNDTVLAAVSGGLRRLFEQRGEELPPAGLRAMVPVNIRAASEHLALGNRISSLFVNLPVAERDPLKRYGRMVGETEKLKSGSQAIGAETLLAITGLAPPVAHSMLAQSLYASRLFNITVTNVPGPDRPLYAMGSRMRDLFGLVPLAADHSVGIAVLSYAGGVTFGIVADRDSVPDLDVLAGGIRESLDELTSLAASTRRRRQGARRSKPPTPRHAAGRRAAAGPDR